jgi:hypothetical protein
VTALVPLHGIATRHDLPLPFGFALTGAALALVASFVVLLLAWRRPRYLTPGGVALPGLTRVVDHPAVRWSARGLMLATFGWAGLALVAGQDRLTNPVFGFVYVWVWVGLVPLSLLFGNVWAATNPIRTVHSGLAALARIDPAEGLLKLPRGVGVWPAAVGLLAFAWLELVQPDRTTLLVMRWWALAWLLSLVIGAVIFGSGWIGAADPFETYARFVAQLSPWRRVDGVLHLVNPIANVTAFRPSPGAVAVVAALLGSTAFDSFGNTTWWIQTVQDSEVSPLWWGTAGLSTMALIVFASFSGAAWGMRWLGGEPVRAVARRMAGSAVPIVVGYVIAHYATLLITEGQRTAITWSDPLGRGWNAFGSAGMGVNPTFVDHPTIVATVQLAAIVTGHVLGVIAAHEKSLHLIRPTRVSVAQLPMLVVMVGYTLSGLALLFSG